jgi:hypothetical protein
MSDEKKYSEADIPHRNDIVPLRDIIHPIAHSLNPTLLICFSL